MPRKLTPEEREERRLARVKASGEAKTERARVRRLKSLAGFAERLLGKYGGGIVREDVGGCVGVRWTTASRDGTKLNDPRLEEALEAGVFVAAPGKPHLLTGARVPA
jgi:hypothetical protein